MLSIIIITKDEEKNLPKLLDSIYNQDYDGPTEIIVSDAKSKDNTRTIARSYGCDVVNGGLPAKGRNNGARVAKGDMFLFLDADTILPKDFIRKNLAEFTYRNLSVATTVYIPISDKKLDKFLYKGYDLYAKTTQYFFPHSGGICIFCYKKIFNRVRGFNERMAMAEDHHFVRKCAKYGRFRIMKSSPLLCDVRRLEKEGRLKLVAKYTCHEMHRIFLGEIYHPMFHYNIQGVDLKKDKRKKDGAPLQQIHN